MQDGEQSETPRRDRRQPRVPASVREARQQEILSLRSTGLTIHAIADQLGIDDNTVRNVFSAMGDPRPLRDAGQPVRFRRLQSSAGKQDRLLRRSRAATEINRHCQAVSVAPE